MWGSTRTLLSEVLAVTVTRSSIARLRTEPQPEDCAASDSTVMSACWTDAPCPSTQMATLEIPRDHFSCPSLWAVLVTVPTGSVPLKHWLCPALAKYSDCARLILHARSLPLPQVSLLCFPLPLLIRPPLSLRTVSRCGRQTSVRHVGSLACSSHLPAIPPLTVCPFIHSEPRPQISVISKVSKVPWLMS